MDNKPVFTALSFLSVLASIGAYIYRVFIEFPTNMFVYINVLFDLVYYSAGFTLNLYSCLFYKDLNINLVLKIEELYKSQIITRSIFRKLTRLNWIYILTCLSVCIFVNCSFIYLFQESWNFVYIEIVCQTVLLIFDIHTIYATQIIKLLRAALIQWLSDIKSLEDIKINITTLKGKGRKRFWCCSKGLPFFRHSCVISCAPISRSRGSVPIRSNIIEELKIWQHSIEDDSKTDDLTSDDAKNECFWEDKLKTYATILDSLELTKTGFQLMIVFHVSETFIHAIFYVYYGIHFMHDFDLDSILSTVLTLTWILKNVLSITILSVDLEYFYIAVNEVVVNSLLQLKNDQCIEQEKQMHKNVVRMSRISPKFAVCNLFALDATMPRRLLSLIATYTIVMLQFVLLD